MGFESVETTTLGATVARLHGKRKEGQGIFSHYLIHHRDPPTR